MSYTEIVRATCPCCGREIELELEVEIYDHGEDFCLGIVEAREKPMALMKQIDTMLAEGIKQRDIAQRLGLSLEEIREMLRNRLSELSEETGLPLEAVGRGQYVDSGT